MVLDHYRPEEIQVLYSAADYINDGKIESYTGRFDAAERFLKNYGMSFYPLSKLLRNELSLEDSLFNKLMLSQYIGEDECIKVYKQVA